MGEAPDWAWRDAGRIAAVARWLLCLEAAAYALSAASYWFALVPPTVTGAYALGALLLAQTGLFTAGGVAALLWLYRASANARALGATDLMGSPAWTVAGFFIPLANLVMPYLNVRDLWKASVNPRDWQAERAPAAIGLWWAFWLASWLVAGLAARFDLVYAAEALPQIHTLAAVSSLLWCPAILLFAWIIGRIQALQTSPDHLRDRFA